MGHLGVALGHFILQLRHQLTDGFFKFFFQVRLPIVFITESIREHKRANLVFSLS